jgi:GTP-binding protein LepA
MSEFSPIRNFVIIAHIDHGKSTLADRLLEITGTVDARRMKPQYLDSLELERERGITIKMAPVRMEYRPVENVVDVLNAVNDLDAETENNSNISNKRSDRTSTTFILNLIDTPGHSDFSYEVSRALEAVEGAILLVDVTKGIQAQTLSNFRLARRAGLTIVGAVNKIDLAPDRAEKVVAALSKLLDRPEDEILRISGKTGEGVEELLGKIIEKIPPPTIRGLTQTEPQINPDESETFTRESASGQRKCADAPLSALVFNSVYDDHKGIVASVRIGSGSVKPGDDIWLAAGGAALKVKEVGIFAPELKSVAQLRAGEIGYIATGFKEPAKVRIGDTFISSHASFVYPGYRDIAPVVFISFYPDENTKFEDLKKAFERLQLNDPALHFEPDSNEALGRGLKVGFLGTLHFEITSDRLRREFGLRFLTSFPSIAYRVIVGGEEKIIQQNQDWPAKPDKVFQPMIKLEILTPSFYLNQVLGLGQVFDFTVSRMETLGDALEITARMPLAELIRDFDEQLKSSTAGYASFSYESDGEDAADVRKMEILVAEEVQPALTRIVSKKDVEREGRLTVERLKKLLPAVQFSQAIQAQVEGRIIARETIAAMKKNLGDFGKNGGDRTRKMKLWKKQKEGKVRLKAGGRVNVPIEVFREILKK